MMEAIFALGLNTSRQDVAKKQQYLPSVQKSVDPVHAWKQCLQSCDGVYSWCCPAGFAYGPEHPEQPAVHKQIHTGCNLMKF
jgi:hypothetical protein